MTDILLSWTSERIELLKKLWSSGLSASRIADELGGVTRNAVIGKVHRLGMSGRGRGDQGLEGAHAPEGAPARGTHEEKGPADAALGAVRAGVAEALMQSGEFSMPDIRSVPEVAAAPLACVRPAQAVVIPLTERVTIMDLREQMCRWPMGDPARADFRFCGARSGISGPYCATHAQMAYQPVLDRRRDRRALASA